MQNRIDEGRLSDHASDLREFIIASPSSYHAAREVARRLDAAGYVRQRPDERWNADPGGHYLLCGGAIVAWHVPQDLPDGFRVVGSHTDSPGLKVKPEANSRSHGFSQINVEIYGGPIPSSWLNRDLGIAGRVRAADGSERLFATGAIMFVPQLAPHLDRGANESLRLDRQRHLHPVWATGERDALEAIAQSAGVAPSEIVGMDAYAYDVQEPELIGEFFAAGRQDNLVSVHASLRALLDGEGPQVAVLAAFDHEEVGSATSTGAAGPILERALRRTALALGLDEEGYYRMLARSSCVSADAGHSVNPNYPEYHDPDQYPVAGSGPMIKLNANQRYASDARGQALWLRASAEAGQATQSFVSNNAVTCGSTIGPFTATRLGIDTVDVGIPLLSMHSVREISALRDSWSLARILRGYWNLA